MNERREEQLVIVEGVRTPFCRAGSLLHTISAVELARQATNALLARTGLDPSLIDEVIFGNVGQPAEAANIARVIALRSGIPAHVPALTVQRNCASGFEAITQARLRLRAGRGRIFIVGGTESMSQIPMLLSPSMGEKLTAWAKSRNPMQKIGALTAFRPADFQPQSGLLLGLTDPVSGLNMGQTAEVLARELDISRFDQDIFAFSSHRKALAARDKLQEEITPVYLPDGTMVTHDHGPREDSSLERLGELKPSFDPLIGTVTAGNASQISDGAVVLLVMSASAARELGLRPLGVLVDEAYVGCDPERMGLGPVPAMARLAQRGYHAAEADRIEINEAFAAQVLAVVNQVDGIDGPEDARLNVNGGAIALGHPVGATGARLVLTALKELQRSNKRTALLSLCVGGGQGAALWLERREE